MKRKYVYLSGIITVILIILVGWLLSKENIVPTPEETKNWEVVVDLTLPDISYFENTSIASITFLREPKDDPKDVLNEILGNYGDSGQCFVSELIENMFENGKWTYRFTLYGIGDEYLAEHDIPSIRQDNVGERFCFYTYSKNIVGGTQSWWDRVGCDSLTFTLILPENYELASDITEPLGGWGGVKDNEFSIFTSAPELSKKLENNRWTIKADWVAGEFDKYNTDFYLEVYYIKLPYASFTYSPVSPNAGETVYFTDQSSGEEIVSWLWDFGDGSTSTDRNPTHIFTKGTYTVTLTVTASDWQTDNYGQQIPVWWPIPIFTDAGLLADSGLLVDAYARPQESEWGLTAPYTDDNYPDVVGIPEGIECWYTRNGPEANTYAGWGVFIGVDPSTHEIDPSATHIIDISSCNELTFWVKTPVNLYAQIQEWNTTTDNKGAKSNQLWVGNYGWENTGGWEKITIPKSAFRDVNFSKIWCPFMISTGGYQPNVEWYVDWVQWES